MKKKLTVGVFLALAVVLVASIVGVGAADAVKPNPFVTATINATPNPEEIGNCSVLVNVVWEDYPTYGIELTWYKDSSTSPIDYVRVGFHQLLPSRVVKLKRTPDGEYQRNLISEDKPCGSTYEVEVQLLTKHRKVLSPIPGANASHVVTCSCP